LSKVIDCPSTTVGIVPCAPRSPREYSKLPIEMSVAIGPEPAFSAFWNALVGAPPWLSFSGRCPWVSTPFWSTAPVKGSVPPGPSYIHTTPSPIDSYHDARFVS